MQKTTAQALDVTGDGYVRFVFADAKILAANEGLARLLGYNRIVFSRETWYKMALSFLRKKFGLVA